MIIESTIPKCFILDIAVCGTNSIQFYFLPTEQGTSF